MTEPKKKLGRAVYCAGGPLHGQGFTEREWQERVETARRLEADDGRRRVALEYSRGDWPWSLPAVLEYYDVTTLVHRRQTRARAQAERFPPPAPVQLVLPDEPERPGLRSLVDAAAECHRGHGHADLYEARIAVARARRRGDTATLSTTTPCPDCGRYHVRVVPGG